MSQSILPEESVVSKIYFIRGEKVMIDRDLAILYGVKAIRLREQVKRNLKSFPDHFMFQLNEQEVETMVSQNAIPSKKHLGGALPYVFTEHGVLMLANILKSEQAVQVSIRIIEVFVQLRKILLGNADLRMEIGQIKKKVDNNSKNIELVFQYLDELLERKENPEPRIQIGYKVGKQ